MYVCVEYNNIPSAGRIQAPTMKLIYALHEFDLSREYRRGVFFVLFLKQFKYRNR
jgi:hypothetical protein